MITIETDKPIGIASDHAGFTLKKHVINLLERHGVNYMDFGTFSEESSDYPDFGHKLGYAINRNECEFGIAICGSGNGINMVVNKYNKVRSGLCWNTEIANLVRLHNNANVLTLPARFISLQEADDIIETFFGTSFEGGRHQIRIEKIPC
jgi:ribose 5-phosphate isomerase B